MELSEEQLKFYLRRLLLSRMRILIKNGFFGLLLMHMTFALDEKAETACTDGDKIYFNPAFLEELSDGELDFVLMHEILHVALRHVYRDGDRDRFTFNVACDIVVNSIIKEENYGDISSITIQKYGVSIHLTPDKKEGAIFTAEEVYEMLKEKGTLGGYGGKDGLFGLNGNPNGSGRNNIFRPANPLKGASGWNKENGDKNSARNGLGWDDHSRWGACKNKELKQDVWEKRFADACEAISAKESGKHAGNLPLFAQRLLKEIKKSKVDWRVILHDFVQQEITDYSFSPPDRRYADIPFFLPDFNEKTEYLKDILFFIDTSGSMTDDEVSTVFTEVKGALEQYNGALKGWLGFFDASVKEPQPFEDIEDLLRIKPQGGGGTSFEAIFEYTKTDMSDISPAAIIILTDGHARFPEESATMGIPVLWMINNDSVDPPWGRVARI